jgi:hypothetical protein
LEGDNRIMEKLIDGLLTNLASKGRYGDTELAHVTEKEASLLKSLGGAGTTNPKTGLKEYHLPEGFYTALWNPAPFPYGTTWAQNRFEDMHGYRYKGAWPITGDFDTKMENDNYREHQERHGYVAEPEVEPSEDIVFTEEQIEKQKELFPWLSWGKSPYEEWTEVTPEELARYINPETGEITNEQGLINYMKKINPQLAEVDEDGIAKYTNEQLKAFAKDLAPKAFASKEDIAGATEEYQSSAALSRQKAKGARLQSRRASGVSGVTRTDQYGFGGADESISEGLYADIGSSFQDYKTDIFGLENVATKGYGDFVYGISGGSESDWGKKWTDYAN